MKFRIGTKLAISSGVGILVLAAIAANDQWDRSARATLRAEARAGEIVQKETLVALVATRRVVIMGRDARMALKIADVDKVLDRAMTFRKEADRALAAAASTAVAGQDRQRLNAAQEIFARYFAAIG